MKTFLSLGAVSLFIGMTAITLSGSRVATEMSASGEGLSERGGWHRSKGLAQMGKLIRPTLLGSSSSHATATSRSKSWSATRRDKPLLGPEQYSQGGYEASFGTYEIDESTHTLTFHVQGALVRTLIGKDLSRVYEFSGKQLNVKSSSSDEHWKVAWEHY